MRPILFVLAVVLCLPMLAPAVATIEDAQAEVIQPAETVTPPPAVEPEAQKPESPKAVEKPQPKQGQSVVCKNGVCRPQKQQSRRGFFGFRR